MALSFKEILDNASSVLGSTTKNKASSGGPSFNDITANVGRYVAQMQRPTISARQKSVADDFVSRIGAYDWKSNYAYDVWSDEDAQRQERGEMPLSLYESYNLDDPVDRYLYNNNLPPKKDLEKWAEKAEKETETAAEEAAYEKYRAQVAEVEKSPFEKLAGGVKKAIEKGATLQGETTPKATAQPAEDVPMYNGVPFYDAVFGDGQPAQPAAQDWRQQIVGAFDKVANLSAAEVAAMHEEQTQAKTLAEETDTREYDAYIRGELDELSPEGLAAHDAKEQIEAYKKSPIHGKDYSFVTDDEWATYAAIYKQKGVEAANGYLSSIYERAAQRSAEDELQRFKGGIVDKVIQTLSAGFDNAIKGVQRLTSKDFIAQTDAPTVQAYQQARSEEEGVAALVSDALFAIGNMTPSMITGGLAGTTAGAVAMGASAAGNAYDAEIKNGNTHEQALLYGALVGVAEGLTSKFLGGVEGISKNLLGKLGYKGAANVLGRVIKNPAVVNAISSVLGRSGRAVSEGVEEYLQDAIIDPILRNIALDEENIIDLGSEEAIHSAMVGAITGGLLGGGNTPTDASINTEATTDTPTAESPAQAEIEAPAEAVQTTGSPVPVGVGDTVMLQDGTTATVQGVSHDPFNNVEMYAVEHDGQVDWLTSQEIVRETPVAAPQTQSEGNLTDMRNEAVQMADSAFSGRTVVTPASIAGGPATYATTWESAAPRINDKAGSQWRDVSRVLDDAAGEDKALRDFLYEQIEKPHNTAKNAYVRNTQQMTRAMKTAYDSFGIKAKSPESAAVFAYTQGYRLDKNGDRIPYGYGEVVRDFPQSYENIIKASAWTREFLDQYHDLINDSRMGIYENAEQAAQRELENLRGQEIFYSDGIARATSDAQTAETPQAKRDAERRADELRGIFNSVQANRMQLEANIASGYYGNKRLAYKSDYMPHYSESPSAWARTLNAFVGDEIRIDPEVVGKTDETKPKSQWSGRFLHQGNGQYVEDAVYALTRYIEEGERLMAFDPVIARMNDPLEGVIQRVRSGTEGHTNANKFIAWAENWTNTLAGKTSGIDRAALALTGNPENRKWMDRLRAINSLVRSSSLLGNVRSALVQIGSIPNAMYYIPNPADWAGGIYRMAGRVAEDIGIKTDGTMKNALDESGFMAGRTHDHVMRGMDDYSKAPSKAASWLLEIGDRGASELIWWSAMSQYERLGGKVKGTRSYESAVDYADDVTRRSVAGRERGDKPVNQVSQIVNLVDPFKLEAVNQLNTMREAIKNKRFGGLAASLIGTFLLNEMFNEMFGDTPIGLDFVRAVVDTARAWADEDDESVQSLGDALERVLLRTAGETISSAPLGAQAVMLATDDANLEKLFGESDPTRYGTGNMGASAVVDPIIGYINGESIDPISSILSFAPAGKQANRVIETAEIQGWLPDVKVNRNEGFVTRTAQTPTSYSNTGRVRFAADTDPLNIIKSMMFGQYATDAGHEYIEGGAKTLSEPNTEVYNDLAAAGMGGKDIMEQLQELSGFKKIRGENYEISAADQKRAHVEESGLTIRQQMILMDSIDDNFSKNAAAAKDLGISNEQFLEYEYARVRIEVELQEYKRDHDGKSPKGGKGKMLMDWLRTQNFTDPQAIFLYELHNDGGTGVPGTWKGWD